MSEPLPLFPSRLAALRTVIAAVLRSIGCLFTRFDPISPVLLPLAPLGSIEFPLAAVLPLGSIEFPLAAVLPLGSIEFPLTAVLPLGTI